MLTPALIRYLCPTNRRWCYNRFCSQKQSCVKSPYTWPEVLKDFDGDTALAERWARGDDSVTAAAQIGAPAPVAQPARRPLDPEHIWSVTQAIAKGE